ncbi:MAG: hypothetical protein FD138_2870, partial [Planctomycetota bacterium]
MPSISRNILVLALATCIGCQSVTRPAPWQTQRVPSPPPATVSPTKPPSRSLQTQPVPADGSGKRVPDPLPDPQAKNGSTTLSNKLNARSNQPVVPGAEQPQIRFKPVQPRSSSEREPTNGTAVGSRDVTGGETTPDVIVSPPKSAVSK